MWQIIEQQILTELKWEQIGDLDLVSRYKQTVKVGQKVMLGYKLVDRVDVEVLEYIKHAVKREAEIRLFSCQWLKLTIC